jgi:hypothetical protein
MASVYARWLVVVTLVLVLILSVLFAALPLV